MANINAVSLQLLFELFSFFVASDPSDDKTLAPNAAIFLAALPAPPGLDSCRMTSRTCTGASGEIRLTFPEVYVSTKKSPSTSAVKGLMERKDFASFDILGDFTTVRLLRDTPVRTLVPIR